jgi:bifunctional autolysin
MVKEHKKLYKAGKYWLVATLTALSMGAVMVTTASADTTTPTAPAQVQESSQKQVTEQPNLADQGNYAHLDYQSVNDQGQLNVSGWHAGNGSIDRPYHYIIAFDPATNREITRQNITDQAVARPDVQQAFNVAGAGQSGFNVNFDLKDQLANLASVQIISRYSADQAGNFNNFDYWFAPIAINQSNVGNLDQAVVKNGELEVAGWHATNLAAGKPYHYLILLDRTTGKEIGRQLIQQAISRPDISRAFPGIYRASQSGFAARFATTGLDFHHQLQVVDRYSKAADGNTDYVDDWFTPFTSTDYVNAGCLDSYNLADRGKITVNGWHVNDISQFEPNHFLILVDNTAKCQVAVTRATAAVRPDIASLYHDLKTARQSGFSGSFDLGDAQLIGGHSYSVVSRYSTSDQDNGGGGQYTDYWFTLPTFNQRAFNIDSQEMTKAGLKVSGWMVSDYSADHPYAYLILLNDGKEIGRQAVTLTARPDVGKAYAHTYGSAVSGFSTLIKLANPAVANGKISLILRFSADHYGNVNNADQFTASYDTNQYSFDKVSVDPYNNTMYVSGWHASNAVTDKPYQYLIFLDGNGHELYRQRVLDINCSRPDIARYAGYLLNSSTSGYQLGFNLPDNMKHQWVTVIHRFTDDVNGNGHTVDAYFNNFFVNSGASLQRDAAGRIIGAINDAEVICQNPELPTGCEMTAVTMMLRYAGVNVDKFQVANETPRSSNGDYGFVGNPYSVTGWWVFPTGIAPVVQRHLGTSQVMTGASLAAIQEKLNIGHLVVVWMANINGFVNHAITLTGYNASGFFYNNPWTGRKEAMSYGEFYSHWNADAQRALSY